MFDKVRANPSSGKAAPTRRAANTDSLAGWLHLTAQGDKRAFKRLYDATAPRLFGQAILMLRARDAAEDVLQETFLRIWSGARHYDPARGHPLAWMTCVMRNVAIDHLRRSRQIARHFAPDGEVPDIAVDPEPVEDRLDLAGALGSLPPEQRNAICRVVIQGWTHEEAAMQDGIPTATTKSRAQRGLRRLRTELDGQAALALAPV